MKFFGVEFGAAGRWYVALPPVLLIGILIALLVIAAAGQARLVAADERVHKSEEREQALDEFLALITETESQQRGYLLTGEDSYLQAYGIAAAQIAPALARLRAAYDSDGQPVDDIRRLRALSNEKLVELNDALLHYRQAGLSPAVKSEMAKRTNRAILGAVVRLRQKESAELSVATARWQVDLRISRWVTVGGAILNIALVLLASVLVYGDMRRRARQSTDLREQKRELARLVNERTRELMALSTHLQEVSELEKSALARELHDELGGLLVAARMDLSWLQQRLPTSDPAIEQRFRRIHDSLSAGVDLKRRVVEELRPTLLDNMGLFAALRWQFKETCRRTGLVCKERIPDAEMSFTADAAIGVFRVAQEALTNILKHAEARSAELSVELREGIFELRVADDGRGVRPDRVQTLTTHGLASMRHRITALGGQWELKSDPTGGTVVLARIPLSGMLAADPAPVHQDVEEPLPTD